MDKSICQDFLDRDKWGIGLFLFNDKAGDGDLKTTEAALSFFLFQMFKCRSKFIFFLRRFGGLGK